MQIARAFSSIATVLITNNSLAAAFIAQGRDVTDMNWICEDYKPNPHSSALCVLMRFPSCVFAAMASKA